MQRRTGVLTLLSLLALAACDRPSGTMEPPEADDAPPAQGRVGPGVEAAVRTASGARVMIALAAPAAPRALIDIAALQEDVALAQEDVLLGLPRDGFVAARRFSAVPALAGTIRNEATLAQLAANPQILRIDLDVGGTGFLGNSVPFIGADLRHELSNLGEGVVVAVLDTGIDTDHPDLADDVLAQACFGDDDGSIDGVGFCPDGSDRQTGDGAAEDDAGHGTHTSGIITSAGTVSAPGVAPGAGIVAIKVLDNCSFAGCFDAFSEIVAALDYIIANNGTLGVDIINMSLGTGDMFTGDCDNATAYNMAGAAAINTLRTMGVIAFASAGNDGSGTQMGSPACLSNVVSVGATDNEDNVAGFSNSNASTDIFAPGVNIVSLSRFGGTTMASGTSMASPHAAGCAALLIEAGEATTPDAIETRLETSPFQVTDATNDLTFPRIDCRPENLPPAVGAGGPYLGLLGLAIPITNATATDPDSDPLDLTWTVNTSACTFSDANALLTTVTCTAKGVFQLTLTAEDGFYVRAATAALTVLSPAEAVEALIADVEAAGLDDQAKSLLAQLRAVLNSIANGANDVAINQLTAFINHVRAQEAKSISGGDAAEWIAAAQQIIAALQT